MPPDPPVRIPIAFIGILISALPWLLSPAQTKDKLDQRAAKQQEAALFNKTLDSKLTEADREIERSSLAIARVKANCIPLVDLTTLVESGVAVERRFYDGQIAEDSEFGNPIINAKVCNSYGDTAETDENGMMIDIARASTEDKDDYDKLFSLLGEKE